MAQQQGDEHALTWCVQFARLYPLGQRDLPIERKHVDFGPLMPASARIENPSRDYTPPSAHHLRCLPAPPHLMPHICVVGMLPGLFKHQHAHCLRFCEPSLYAHPC